MSARTGDMHQLTYPSGAKVDFAYDAAGHLLSAIDSLSGQLRERCDVQADRSIGDAHSRSDSVLHRHHGDEQLQRTTSAEGHHCDLADPGIVEPDL